MQSISTRMAISIHPPRTSQLEQFAKFLRRPYVALLLLIACIFGLYYGTLSFEFVWDDFPQIVDNPMLHSWNIRRAFLSDLWFHTNREQVFYRPLFVIWSILNFKIFALKSAGWHLTTLLMHIAATCMVFWVARRLKVDYWTALLAALLFGLHPIHIECAAWISSGSDSMMTIFYLLAFVAYLKTNEPQANRRGWTTLSYAALACALLTKEMAVTFAVIIALYEWVVSKEELHRRAARLRRSVLSAAPYALITAGYLVLRTLVLHRATNLDSHYSNLAVILTLPIVLFSYLRLLILPKGLTTLYYTPYTVRPEFWNFVFPLCVLLLVAAALWLWSRRSRDPLINFFAFWLLISLTPTLCLRAFPAGSGVRDRYIYLGSVGFAVLTAKLIRAIKDNSGTLFRPIAQGTIVAVVCIFYAIGIWTQQIYWASNLLLFYRGYSLYPNSFAVQMNVAGALIQKREYLSAIAMLNEVIRQYPGSGEPYYSLAEVYVSADNDEASRRALETALQLKPDLLQSDVGRVRVATLLGELGDFQGAVKLYEQVLSEEPEMFSAVYGCGYTYFLLKSDSGAESLLLRAAQLAPRTSQPLFYLGQIYFRTGRLELAEGSLRKALSLDPQVYGYHYWLGRVLASRGDVVHAKMEYSEELKLHPSNHDALAEVNPQSTSSLKRGTSVRN
jgi:protein O-mannosyl-transferase